MKNKKLTFALYFGNRGFFPESLIALAREELSKRVAALGHNSIMLDASLTRYGAVETPAEGAVYAKFLEANRGKYDGVILSLPNFGDETGAVSALRDCGVPILIQAYPDELDKLDNARRRDAFCGKFSVMDVFWQYGVKFTNFTPHVVAPSSAEFEKNLRDFAAVCSVVKSMRRFNLGAIGARTTAFKTVRFDELALERRGITTETFDLSEVIYRTQAISEKSDDFAERKKEMVAYSDFSKVPEVSVANLVKLSIVLDQIIKEADLGAIALRCWIELEKILKIAPCVLLGRLNHLGVPAACELDVCNAVAMRALAAASGGAATCLDWNNNWGSEADKCILFHCGPVAASLMTDKGHIAEHFMFAKSFGSGCGWGPCQGRIRPGSMTYASSKTENGDVVFYSGEGRITEDKIPAEFFGCAGVAEISDLQLKLKNIGDNGFRHHVSMAFGNVEKPMREALGNYLGYKFTQI